MTFSPADTAGRAHRATEYLHSYLYFAPEHDEELVAVGLRPGRMCYFAARSAPMGAVTPETVTATFYNFNPETVARVIPRAWGLAGREDILAARLRAVDRSMRRIFGDEVLDGADLAELAELTREACTALTPEARPLYAGHAGLDWPDEPHLVLWHAATLLREYRGDGHLFALLNQGLCGIDAIMTHVPTGHGFPDEMARVLRGWSEEQWEDSRQRLIGRGILDETGRALTEQGDALRAQLEAETDALDTAAWRHLGEDRTLRVIELGKGLTRTIAASGAFGSVR